MKGLRKGLAIVISFFLIITVIPYMSYAANQTEDNAINNLLKSINEEMKVIYGEINYYGMYNKAKKKFNLNTYKESKSKYEGLYVIAYGSPNNFNQAQQKYRYLGYNREDQYVGNPDYDYDYGYGALQLHKKSLIREPWTDESVISTYHISEGVWDGEVESIINPSDGSQIDFEALIQEGINKQYAGKFDDGILMYTKDQKPPSGRWSDYVHVITPPTMYSRGQGFMYLKMKSGNPHYISVDIAAVSELSDSLQVEVKLNKDKVRNGDPVVATVDVKSSFKSDVKANYRWKIVGRNTGKDYATGESMPITYEGYGKKQSGNEIIPKEGARFIATIEMPSEPLTIVFEIEAIEFKGKSIYVPAVGEKDVEWERFLRYHATYKLDYDELTKEIDHTIAKNDVIDASVELPNKSNAAWISGEGGYLTGPSVRIDTTQASNIFINSEITNNESVNEPGSSVVRSPHLKAGLDREKFGDKPLVHDFLNLVKPKEPITKKMTVPFGGSSVSKPYTYTTEEERIKTREDGTTYTETYTQTHSATATGSFVNGEDAITANIYAYNGKKNMPDVPARAFKKEVITTSGGETPKTKVSGTVLWESDKYPMRVQRWMAHVDVAGGKTWQAVPGQYERIFSQQNKATIVWNAEKSMKSIYAQDRKSAQNRVTNKNGYPHVPFATDRDLQRFEYPFKAGYYFNPAGQYVLKVRTEIFKDTSDSTVEHKALVDQLIASFRYGSNMDYKIDTGKLILKFDDSEVAQPKDTLLNATRDYNLVDTVEIEHSPDSIGTTHTYFKEILEGYAESNTQSSKDSFKYREYVEDGQSIYKIIEETTMTITVNEDNNNVLTHGGMKDGNYYMTAWIEPTDISSITHVPNMKVKGSAETANLDEIKITVKGSMYDDLNN